MSNARNAREKAAAAAAAAEKKRRVKVALTYTGLVAAVLVIVVVIAFVARSSNKGPAVEGNFAADLTTLTGIPQSTYDAVAAGSASKLSTTPGAPLTENGKPVVVYVGADFCPFCAGQRWALIAALSRFGTWSNIARQSSSSTDVYPSTSTFSFHGATYSSRYVVFSGTEVEDVNQRPLDTPPARDNALWNSLDPKGYFPFVSVGGRYSIAGSQFQPTSLHTDARDPYSGPRSWDEIVADLANPHSAASQQILGAANVLTAEICSLTNNQPANVCTSAGVLAAK